MINRPAIRRHYLYNESNCLDDKDHECDGVVHCPSARDEAFDLCRKTFPNSATIHCLEADRSGYDVSILATPCNNIRECENGEDEAFCDTSYENLSIWCCVFFLLIFGAWCITHYLATGNEIPHPNPPVVINKGDLQGNDLAAFKVS